MLNAPRVFVGIVFVVLCNGCTVNNFAGGPVSAPTKAPRDQTMNEAPEHEQIPKSIAEAIQVCKAVQEEQDIPIGCESNYWQGKPVMTVGFENRESLDAYAGVVGKWITGPFCESANRASRQALILLGSANTKEVILVNCETGEYSDWISLESRFD